MGERAGCEELRRVLSWSHGESQLYDDQWSIDWNSIGWTLGQMQHGDTVGLEKIGQQVEQVSHLGLGLVGRHHGGRKTPVAARVSDKARSSP